MSDCLDIAAKWATIAGAVGLWVAYLEYRHSVKLAKLNERRAAVELAARECAHYGSVLMKQLAELVDKINKSDCEYLKHCKVIKENEQLKLDSAAVTDEDRQKLVKHSPEIMCVLNSLEGFAIPFASGVADDTVGYMECGRSFASIFENYFPLYCTTNLEHYFKSSQKLYWHWKKRIDQEELEREVSQAGVNFITLSEKLVRGQANSPRKLALAGWLSRVAEQLSKSRR